MFRICPSKGQGQYLLLTLCTKAEERSDSMSVQPWNTSSPAPSKLLIATGQNKDCGIQTLDISAKRDSDQQQLLAEHTATHMYNPETQQSSCAL